MSNKFIKAKSGINLEPQTSPPSGMEDGDIYHDITTGLMVKTGGVVAPAGSAGTPSSTPSGALIMYAGATAPSGWLLCGGQAVSRTTYANLFAVIGTTYGVGDNSTTFNLPDLRGRTVAGKDDMNGVAANRLTAGVSGITGTTLGAVGGSEILHQHNHGPGTFETSLSGTFASSSHTHNMSHFHQWAAGDTISSGGTLFSRSQSTPGWTKDSGPYAPAPGVSFSSVLSNNNQASTNGAGSNKVQMTGNGLQYYTTGALSDFNSLSPNTGGNSANASLSGSNTVTGLSSNTGTGSSQNVQPTIVLNYIIKT